MKKMLTFFLSLCAAVCIFTALGMTSYAETDVYGAGKTDTGGSRLNVRSQPTTSSEIITRLYDEQYVTLISRSENGWWYVKYSSSGYGWCSGNYIEVISEDVSFVDITSGKLNVRRGPGTSYAVKTQFVHGTVVPVLYEKNGWNRVLYDGGTVGWVYSGYLSVYGEKYQAVYTGAPLYKQTDKRWATVSLGGSYETVKSAGCAVCCVAMSETIKTGRTIYPDDIAQTYRFSSSGAIYWPEDYTTVTSEDGYLEIIYEQLKKGTPVLLGGKTSGGSQHWVLVTGFTGGNELTADKFLINDPGSASRTTVADYRSRFTVFYKILFF